MIMLTAYKIEMELPATAVYQKAPLHLLSSRFSCCDSHWGTPPTHQAPGEQHCCSRDSAGWRPCGPVQPQTLFQQHLLHHPGALQVHHRHGRPGVHRAVPVQGGVLHPAHLVHRAHLHPPAQHAHRPHEWDCGEDIQRQQEHLETAGMRSCILESCWNSVIVHSLVIIVLYTDLIRLCFIFNFVLHYYQHA